MITPAAPQEAGAGMLDIREVDSEEGDTIRGTATVEQTAEVDQDSDREEQEREDSGVD